jgi:hypothetical protein
MKTNKTMAKVKELSSIAIVRREAFYLDKSLCTGGIETTVNESTRTQLIGTFNIKLAQRGYALTAEAIDKLKKVTDIDALQELLVTYLRQLDVSIGNDVKYVPMYPGFPREVMSLSDAELFINAILHYWSNGNWQPAQEEREHYMANMNNDDESVFETIKHLEECKAIDIIDDDSVIREICFNLISSKTSLSVLDMHTIAIYFEYLHKIGDVLPEINYKENLAFVTNMSIEKIGIENIDVNDYKNVFKTATDVLRYYVAVSGGDISLAKPTKFKNCPRKQYKFMMDLLNNIKNLIQDMGRYPEYWKRVGEKIHPGSYSSAKYNHVQAAFNAIRSDLKVVSWKGEVEKLFNEGKWSEAVDKLIERPGEFARKLDYLLRNADKETCEKVISLFIHCANKLTVPVLLQIKNHFEYRYNNNDSEPRVFFPKGQTTTAFVMENKLRPIDERYTLSIIKFATNAIRAKLAEKDFMGYVYIDPSFNGFVVPSSQRSASETSKIATRGSRWKLKPGTKTIRSFIWWTNTERGDRVDLDSSITFLDENFIERGSVSYMQLRICGKNGRYLAIHSGDIVNGGDADGIGVAEFADCDIDALVQNGIRYAVFTVHSYTSSIKFNEFNSRAGFMEIDNALASIDANVYDEYYHESKYERFENAAKIFDPSKVAMNMDLTAPSNVCVPYAIDLVEREVIWMDMSTDSNQSINNIKTSNSSIVNNIRAVINNYYTQLSELVQLNIDARGIRVYSPDKADIVFSLEKTADNVITPWEIDRFMSEFM